MAVKAKELRFEVELDAAGRGTLAGGPELELPEAWSPEHLVLASLVSCTLTSFRYAAGRRGAAGEGSGRATGIVTRRADDGRFAFVEIDVHLDVRVDPVPAAGIDDLLAHAQRGCFIGNSLTAKPRYRWTVNGAAVASAA